MGRKENNNNVGGKVKQQDDKQAGREAGKKKPEKTQLSVVFKVEMHCEGCASKLLRLTRGLDGVESAKAEVGSNKLTVVGFVDPLQIRDKFYEKTKKKVDLISPQPKKLDDGADKNDNGKKKDEKKQAKPETASAAVEKQKPKEVTVATTTAVLKLTFHCQGCVEKIRKIVSKTKGVQELVAMDKQKETVTVTGTMDVKELAEALKERLKRSVETMPPKDGDKEGRNNGGGKKKNGGSGGENGEGEVSRVEFLVQLPGHDPATEPSGFGALLGYGNGGYPVYGGQVGGYPVYMKFNDENPNAWAVM